MRRPGDAILQRIGTERGLSRLRRSGFMGRKLGQHFLRSAAVLDGIVAAAQPGVGEAVLEIGPGMGALTERLLARGANLVAVEVDPALISALTDRWSDHPRLRIVQADILKLDLLPARLFGADATYAIVANLPYYLSTPLLFRLAACRGHFSRLILMVQAEVAERIAAAPEAGKRYGSLSIAIQHAFAVRLLQRVPPSAFRPPPKVHSAVIELKPRPLVLTAAEEARFFEHVKGLFTRRRKLMASGLRAAAARLPPARWTAVQTLIGNRRAEDLTPEEHLQVFRALECTQGGP